MLRRCRVSVSQAGYNTVLDILAAGARAVVVPFASERETEQQLRAERLAARGVLELLPETQLTAAARSRHRTRDQARPSDDLGRYGRGASLGPLNREHDPRSCEYCRADKLGILYRGSPAVLSAHEASAARRFGDDSGMARSGRRTRPVGRAGRVATLWWRDDDAVTASSRLDRLVSVAGDVPISLAVIPAAAHPELAAWIAHLSRSRKAPRLAVLQHGWCHTNHAVDGKKNEFPPERSGRTVRSELTEGRDRLMALFGTRALPVLTPPWNRFASCFMPLLAACGLGAISRAKTPAHSLAVTRHRRGERSYRSRRVGRESWFYRRAGGARWHCWTPAGTPPWRSRRRGANRNFDAPPSTGRGGGHVPSPARRNHEGTSCDTLARCSGSIRGRPLPRAMTCYAYPTSAMYGDYLRAAAGFVPTAAILATMPVGTVAATVLSGFGALFAVFGVRTILRHGTRFDMTESALRASGLRRTSIAWAELDRMTLAYYSTRRDRRDGWMQLELRSGGRRYAWTVGSRVSPSW